MHALTPRLAREVYKWLVSAAAVGALLGLRINRRVEGIGSRGKARGSARHPSARQAVRDPGRGLPNAERERARCAWRARNRLAKRRPKWRCVLHVFRPCPAWSCPAAAVHGGLAAIAAGDPPSHAHPAATTTPRPATPRHAAHASARCLLGPRNRKLGGPNPGRGSPVLCVAGRPSAAVALLAH